MLIANEYAACECRSWRSFPQEYLLRGALVKEYWRKYVQQDCY